MADISSADIQEQEISTYDQNYNYLGDTKDIEIPIGESVQDEDQPHRRCRLRTRGRPEQ